MVFTRYVLYVQYIIIIIIIINEVWNEKRQSPLLSIKSYYNILFLLLIGVCYFTISFNKQNDLFIKNF